VTVVILLQAAVLALAHHNFNGGVGLALIGPERGQGKIVRIASVAFHCHAPLFCFGFLSRFFFRWRLRRTATTARGFLRHQGFFKGVVCELGVATITELFAADVLGTPVTEWTPHNAASVPRHRPNCAI